jgi:trigger factor
MQVTETVASGLKRELNVIVGQGELGQRFSTRLGEVKEQVQIRGFRKGKVPVAHIKKLYGRSLMAEVLQQTVEETSRKAIADRNERPAHQPEIKLTEDKDEIERVLSGQSDLAFTMSFEILPEIKIADLTALMLERWVAEVTEEAVENAVGELRQRSIRFESEADRVAGQGDRLTIDFLGRVDGVAFEGGKGEDVQLVIGQSTFIPGFVEGVMGAKAGEEREISPTFPDNYPEKTLAGKVATFTVKVKDVARSVLPELNDEFAHTLGAESLAKLREMVRVRIASEYASLSRLKLKRQILDALDKEHDFTLPQTLVDAEFEGIWGQLTQSLQAAGKTIADQGKSEEEMRSEYRTLAQRRVRLGLVIGEIGSRNKVEVAQPEIRRALIEQARRYPGQERVVYEYYEKNPHALAELRAPIFEDKVVDLVIEQARIVEKKVFAAELVKSTDEESGQPAHVLHPPIVSEQHHDHDHHDHDHPHGHDHDHHHPHDQHASGLDDPGHEHEHKK